MPGKRNEQMKIAMRLRYKMQQHIIFPHRLLLRHQKLALVRCIQQLTEKEKKREKPNEGRQKNNTLFSTIYVPVHIYTYYSEKLRILS